MGVPGECPTPTRENPPKGERQPTGTTEMRHYQSGGITIGDTAYYLHLTAESYPDITARVKQAFGDLVPPVTGGPAHGD